MDPRILILIGALIVYVPLAGLLLYVWYKYGKHENAIKKAAAIFLAGSLFLFGYMITL